MQQNTSRQTIALYWQHIRRHRLSFVLLCIFAGLAVIFGQVLTPYIVATALDRLSTHSYASFSDFVPLLVLYAAVLLGELVTWRVMVYTIWKFEVAIMQELMERSFSHLLHQSNRFHTNRFGGALVSQVNKFVGSFERLSDTFFFDIVTFAVYFVCIVAILASRVPLYALVLVIGSGVYLLVLRWRSRKQRPLNVAEAQSESDRTAQLADTITNIATAKAYSHEELEEKLFHKRTEHTRLASERVMRMSIRNDVYFNTITSSVGWLALIFAVLAIVQFHAPLGTVLLIVNYTSNTMRRLWEMARVTRTINRSFGDAHDMTVILDLEPDVKDIKKPLPFSAVRGDIRFTNVRFAYPEQPDKPLFDKFSLHIKPGEKVGLVGRSGGGKTTLSKLILRFSDIQAGTISIDNQDISQVRQHDVRSAIAYVPQEPLMFHRSIADNIRYGRIEATRQEIEIVAKMAHAHDFISGLSKGYDTLVGERGTKLSGGQRQRVAIARAMLKHAPILFLDEATSALDSESELLIQDALWKLMDGRTAIVIAHRLSTIQKMDRIIVLDNGKVVEEGSHKELIAKGGSYADLWSHQSGGFLED